MRLKKLVIVGFKSFAEKTTLHFDPGVTCIVGPNGCGKSNIADAFRWVLGEQSAKSMRGNKMPDVIFAGTSQRKSLNVAEVSLTLTDVQGALPIDYEEITLTRRLHRSGESEYLINGNLVRLKDMQGLFLDSGIGKNAFSIFEQGKIDQVINYSPVERRYIFEEAAGILRFLQRKKESLKRLEQADQNLDRVKDIHKEVEQQIVVLKKQAEKARIYKDNQILLEQLEKTCYVLKWTQLDKKEKETDKRLQKQQVMLAELNEKMQHLKDKEQEVKRWLQQQEKAIKIKNEALYQLKSEKEIHTREHISNQEYLKEAQQKEKKLKTELEELRLTQQSRRKMLQDISQRQSKVDLELKEFEGKLNFQQDKVKNKEKEVNQLRQDLNAKQQNRLKLLQTESQMESEWKQNEVRLEHHRERRKQFDERLKQQVEDLKQIAQVIQEKRQQLKQVSALVDSHKERLDQYEEDLKQNAAAIEKEHKELEGLKRKLMERKARQAVLVKMREDHEGFSSGSKQLLKESDNPNSPLYGKIHPLYEYLKPKAEMAEALATILKAYAHTLVVKTEKDFESVLQLANELNIQDYSFICLEWIEMASSKQGTFASQVDSGLLADHFLKHVQTVNTHLEALPYFKPNFEGAIWSYQKGFFDRFRVFFSPGVQENQVFLRESELRELEEEINQKEDQVLVLDKQLQQLQQRKAHLQMERIEVDKMLRRDEMKLVEVNFGLQRSLGDQEKVKGEQAQVQKELTALEQHIDQQQQALQQLKDKHWIVKQELTQFNQEVEFLEKEVETQNQSLRIQQQDQKEKTELYQKLMEDKRQLDHQVNLLEAKEQDHHKQEQRISDELADSTELQVKMKEKGAHFHQQLEKLEVHLQEAIQACQQLEQGAEEAKGQLTSLERELNGQHALIKKNEEESNHIHIQLAQYRSAASALEAELQERYVLTMDDIKPLVGPDTKSLDQTEKQIRSLRQALQEAGNVNMTSIEELEKQEERYQFLNQQMQDMTGSREELLEIINQLDTQSRKIFRETFEAIRANFQKNFQILFNGGEADLQFTETDNVLEAGIEISARPPGKQMRSMTLLSGGEKCLTAVALLFAIFEVKPSPFCILDEIDAPLDDTNVERFVNVVKHFVDRCQFLIITHNKRTMAVGDVLFGISMEEKGVSKVLSLEFSQESAPEALLV